MSTSKVRQVPALPHLVCGALIPPSVMFGAAILLDRFVFGASLWVLGLIVGWPIGVGAGLGALRLWTGKLGTLWSAPGS
jgi:hypothetical protein